MRYPAPESPATNQSLVVALSRAQDCLVVFTEKRVESPFLEEIQKRVRLTAISWDEFAPVLPLDEAKLVIRVLRAYQVRNQLKKQSYRWDERRRCWYRVVAAKGFSFDALMNEPWARDAGSIEVYSEEGELLYSKGRR